MNVGTCRDPRGCGAPAGAGLARPPTQPPRPSAELASADLDAVLKADAVLVVASEHDGRGMFVKLGAALARARNGDLKHVVVVSPIRHDSVFVLPPRRPAGSTVDEWLAAIA